MLWIVLVVAVGVAGLGVVVWYCIRLTRKVGALAGEVAVLAEQGVRLLDLLEQVELPNPDGAEPWDPDSALSASRRAFDSEPDVG